MFKKVFIFLLLSISSVSAYSPLSVSNNRFGIHIFSPDEIFAAAKLVNSSGGDWGYVTIPIRSNDRDPEKWTTFFLNCRTLHIIPIIRLATYPDNANWVVPNVYDLVDFANFLNDMPWPTQNRYVILFNEPNHAKEWGGSLDPEGYATLLLDAQSILKSRSQDFFLISAGLDMSAPNSTSTMDALNYYQRMSRAQPQWYYAIDGISVHAYPNPGFNSSVYSNSRFGILSFKFEQNLLTLLGYPSKPLFITETGSVSSTNFYPAAFARWTDPQIVAITPFVLFAGAGDFVGFSIANTPAYQDIFQMPKTLGSPLLAGNFVKTNSIGSSNISPQSPSSPTLFTKLKKLLFPSPPQITIGDSTITVEISRTESARQKGLSGRDNLPENTGMLFIFDQPAIHKFWMKDMKFALDFIWINNYRIVELTSNIPPVPPENTLTPKQPIDQVLEVPAGFIQTNNIKVGDSITY